MNPKFPFPTMFITSSLLLLITKLTEYQDSLVTRQMFTPVNKTYQGPLLLHGPMQCGHSTHEDVQKGKHVKLQSSYPEEDGTQISKEMTVFFVSFTINTLNSLAERQAKFKIVHI